MDDESRSTGNSTAIIIVCVLAGLGFLVLAVIGIGAAFVYMQRSVVYEDLMVEDFAVAPTTEVTVRCDASGKLTLNDTAISLAEFKSRIEQSNNDTIINVYVDPNCPYSNVKDIEDFCVESFKVYDYYFETLQQDKPFPERSAYQRAMDIGGDPASIVELTIRCNSAGKIAVDGQEFTLEALKTKVNDAGEFVALNIYVDPACPYNLVRELEDFCVEADHVSEFHFGELSDDKELPEISLYRQNTDEAAMSSMSYE